MGKGGGWWYMEDAAGPGKRSGTKSESKNKQDTGGEAKGGQRSREFEKPRDVGVSSGAQAALLSSSSRRPMRLASRIDKTPVGDHNIHGPVIGSGRYLLSFVSELKIHHIPRPRLFGGHLCVTCSMGLNS